MSDSSAVVTGCVFFCHGARDENWRKPFEAIMSQYQTAQPDQPAALGFLELMTPSFEQAVAEVIRQGANHVRVVPLFLAPGRHTRRDLPALMAQEQARWPNVGFSVVPTLTEIPTVRDAIVDWALRSPQAPAQ